MRVVYQAEDILDAYMVKAILQDHGVESHVLGEYLQGGMGELPASGLVQVAVAENDVKKAEKILRRKKLF